MTGWQQPRPWGSADPSRGRPAAHAAIPGARRRAGANGRISYPGGGRVCSAARANRPADRDPEGYPR